MLLLWSDVNTDDMLGSVPDAIPDVHKDDELVLCMVLCRMSYQLFTNMMNARIQEQMKVSHPFEFKHIRELRKLSDFDDSGPSVG